MYLTIMIFINELVFVYLSYPGIGFGCADNNCSPNAKCEDVADSYRCICKSGYDGDGISCLSKFKRLHQVLSEVAKS